MTLKNATVQDSILRQSIQFVSNTWIAAVLSLLIATEAHGDGETPWTELPKTITVSSDLWCPYSCDEDAEQQGYLVEVARAAMALQGIEIKYKVMPWSRAYIQGEKGQVAMVLGVVPGDTGNLQINKRPLAWDKTVMVVRKEDNFVFSDEQQLDALRVGTVAEYTYDNGGTLDQYLAKRRVANDRISEIFSADPLSMLYMMLIRKRIDVFFENADVALYEARRMGLEDRINLVETGRGNRIHVGFPPSETGRQMMVRFDESIHQLMQSGVLEDIRKRYSIHDGFGSAYPLVE